MEKFGAFVRKERKASKISLREMAMMIGVSPIYLSKVERDMFPPTGCTVHSIAQIIGCDPDLLLARAGQLSARGANGRWLVPAPPLAALRSGDWVRLREPDAGCRYGRVLSADRRRVHIQTDAFNDLTCLSDEVTGPLDQFSPPHPFFPMRKKLPYGRYNCSDGSYVLFNRDYEPLYRVQPDGTFSACDPREWIRHVSKDFFYKEGHAPWRNRLAFDISVLQLPAKINGAPVAHW